MARQIRIEHELATYHVMARGNHGQAISGDEQDRKVWLEARRTHGEVEAERLLEAGLAVLGVPSSQLAETGKGTSGKEGVRRVVASADGGRAAVGVRAVVHGGTLS